MSNKKKSVVMGIILTAATCYIVSKLWKRNKDKNINLEKGEASFREGDYKMALTYLLTVQNPSIEILEMISESHIKLGNSINALKFLNTSIKIQRAVPLIQKRFQIHSNLSMSREAFKDLFLINLIDNSSLSKEKANEFLRKISQSLSRLHKIEGMASTINYADFFETLLFIRNEQDPVVVFLNSKEYEKCFNFVLESELPLHRFILGCFYLINGDQKKSLKILEKLDFVYAWILIKFIKSKKLTETEKKEIIDKTKDEEDPTILLYCSKIFENLGDIKIQLEYLQKCMEKLPNASAVSSLIVMHIKHKNQSKALALIKSALKEFPESINLVCIALEYFLLLKEVENAIKIIEMSEQLFPNDPRLYLFKYTISEVLGKPDRTFLEKGIKEDPKYFKLYIYIGNTSNTAEESIGIYKKALESARSFDEIFAAYQLLIVVETQEELFKEFPDLFYKKEG